MTASKQLVHAVTLLLTFTFLFLTSFNTQAKPWKYEDRQNWLALPQSQLEINGESYALIKLDKKPDKSNAEAQQKSPRLYLFFNESAEPNNGDALLIQGLAETADVWFFDTADTLFIDRARITLRGLDGHFIKDVVDYASEQYHEVVVVTYDAMSVAVLRGLRLWQETADARKLARLKNLILLYPSLYVNAPIAGETPEIFPIAYRTALPVTILQPLHGAQANNINMSERALRMGGSLVDIETVPIATDGYYKYQDIRQMANDAIKRIPAVSDRKIKVMNRIKYKVAQQEPLEYEIPESKIIAGLVEINPEIPMQTIRLSTFEGQTINVPKDYKGKALLVNFWATWCPHCVEEIPSMNRALQALDTERFAMISISYKDTQEIMSDFVKKVQVDFPILMDYDGTVSKQWNVFAYPSSFLIDANGMIHYSINAGAIWDAPEMLEKLAEVMEVPYQE